jgi:hypothetical protein
MIYISSIYSKNKLNIADDLRFDVYSKNKLNISENLNINNNEKNNEKKDILE